ncbi:MAG: PilZ domain-containing protein [Candidatus Acidiferrales bacterium]
MQEDEIKNYSEETPGETPVGTQEAERRGADRHPFSAAAEVIELTSGVRFSGRTTDLGFGGCFLDTMVPFLRGAKVRVLIHKGKEEFQTEGTVVYAQTGLGMGIAFDPLDAEQSVALDAWLLEATTAQRYSFELGSTRVPKAGTAASSRATFVRLIQLLVTKGVLTQAEASSVLYDPII